MVLEATACVQHSAGDNHSTPLGHLLLAKVMDFLRLESSAAANVECAYSTHVDFTKPQDEDSQGIISIVSRSPFACQRISAPHSEPKLRNCPRIIYMLRNIASKNNDQKKEPTLLWRQEVQARPLRSYFALWRSIHMQQP